jgi:AhpD family alkylhydroperoxidase
MLIRLALRRALTQIQHVRAVPPRRAKHLVARVYRQVERDFGMLAPPVGLHSPAPDTLAACWTMLRETLVAAGSVDRATKEAVAAAVSLGNACPYCVEVHSTTLHGLTRDTNAAAIAEDRIDAVTDPGVREIARWARASGTRDGAVRPEVAFPAEQVAELVGVAVTFQYLNRMVNVFLGESPLPPRVPAAARDGARRFLGRVMRPAARRAQEPGLALELLPAAALPEDLRWTVGNPTIADAFARAAAAIEAAGVRSVPEPVRAMVTARLAEWDGRPTGPSRAWVTEATSGLPAAERAAGRLALLTAMASYQVDQVVIDEFRGHRPDDAALVELTAWAAFAAARRVAGWMPTAAETGAANPSR